MQRLSPSSPSLSPSSLGIPVKHWPMLYFGAWNVSRFLLMGLYFRRFSLATQYSWGLMRIVVCVCVCKARMHGIGVFLTTFQTNFHSTTHNMGSRVSDEVTAVTRTDLRPPVMLDSVMTMHMIHVHFDRCQQSQDSESRAPCLRVYSHFLTQTHLYPVREPPAHVRLVGT
jgi:hypothetical protein